MSERDDASETKMTPTIGRIPAGELQSCVCIRDRRSPSMEGEGNTDWNDFLDGESYQAYRYMGPNGPCYTVRTEDPVTGSAANHFFEEHDFQKHFILGGYAEWQQLRLSRHKHKLDAIERTKGGHKLKTGELMYAVYTHGGPAGICGLVWRHNGYRSMRWSDEGLCLGPAGAEYDLPFAPERVAPEPVVVNQDLEVNWQPGQRLVSFGQAIEALKQGKRVTRQIWGGYWLMANADVFPSSTNYEDFKKGSTPASKFQATGVVMAHLKDGGIAVAQPTQEDWLATDWIILD